MSRLNLTLDVATYTRLERHARKVGQRRATLVRTLVREGLERREAIERRKKLARDYVADRSDASDLLDELESGELELLDET